MQLDQPSQAEQKKPDEPKLGRANPPVAQLPVKEKPTPSRYRDTKPPRHHATVIPRYHDTMIETIRAAVKVFGKEAATHRFTLEEKRKLRDLVYAYERQGIRTNENVIARIGVNFMIEDYETNGVNSVLHQVLKALNG